MAYDEQLEKRLFELIVKNIVNVLLFEIEFDFDSSITMFFLKKRVVNNVLITHLKIIE